MPNQHYQPKILHFSNQLNQQEQVEKYLVSQYQDQITASQIRWMNESGEGIGIDEVRDITYGLSFSNQKLEVIVLLQADSASTPAQNALLKTLEEPPDNVLIVLATGAIDDLLPTITSRCQIVEILSDDTSQLENFGELQTAWQTIHDSSSLAKLIDFAEKYKDRDKASQLVKELIIFLHNQRNDTQLEKALSLNTYTKSIGLLQSCLSQLNANANVRLSLENCFFSIHQLED